MNKQPRMKSTCRGDGALYVINIWETIQGEGPYSGVPAVFVRLAGCNLDCPLCDTDYTTGSKLMTPIEIFDTITVMRSGLVVITGGEPFRQNLHPLLSLLLSKDHIVQIETNGSIMPNYLSVLTPFINDEQLMLVCSPKVGRIPDELYQYIHSLKYVVEAGNVNEQGFPKTTLGNTQPLYPPDMTRVEEFGIPIYVQPADRSLTNDEAVGIDMWGAGRSPNSMMAVELCMKHGYILSLQLHKIVGLE